MRFSNSLFVKPTVRQLVRDYQLDEDRVQNWNTLLVGLVIMVAKFLQLRADIFVVIIHVRSFWIRALALILCAFLLADLVSL